jgi:hypothetical protein
LSSQFASDNNALYPSIGADLDVVKKSFIEVSSMGYRAECPLSEQRLPGGRSNSTPPASGGRRP